MWAELVIKQLLQSTVALDSFAVHSVTMALCRHGTFFFLVQYNIAPLSVCGFGYFYMSLNRE